MGFSTVSLALVAAGALLAVPFASEAQQARTPPTVGFVVTGRPPCPERPANSAFDQGLRELGYVPGRNITVERRCYAAASELKNILNEFVERRVDVIFAGNGEAAVAAHQTTAKIPIVALHTDPVAFGLAASLARPGRNFTGLTFSAAPVESLTKRLELVKEMAPRASRVAVLDEPSRFGPAPPPPSVRKQHEEAATTLGVTLHFLDIRVPDDLIRITDASTPNRFDAVVINGAAGILFSQRRRIVDWTNERRLPAIFNARFFVDEGGLMFWGASFPALYHRSAAYIDKILKGANPGDLPIERPTKYELVINVKTANALGLAIPSSMRLRADQLLD